MQAQITVAYVNQPKEGQKNGNIKTDKGEFFTVWTDKLNLSDFEAGKSYTIEYTTRQGANGQTYKTVKEIIFGTNRHADQPEVKQANGRGHAGKNEEDIAVLAIMKSYIEAGKVPDILHLSQTLQVIRDHWRDYKASAQ